eukprot:7310811-Alexandrium_andersonii.AAC.1
MASLCVSAPGHLSSARHAGAPRDAEMPCAVCATCLSRCVSVPLLLVPMRCALAGRAHSPSDDVALDA